MKVYQFEDVKTKKLVREVGERMDNIALSYIDLMIDVAEQTYPYGATDEEWAKFCDDLSGTFEKSLNKAFTTRGLD